MFLLGAVDGDAAPEHRVLYVRAPGRGTSIDDVLSRRNRLVLEGAAGSGKTTLLRRLAVRCLDDDHPWGGERTPFLVKLRSLVHDGRLVLPVVEEFTTATGSTPPEEVVGPGRQVGPGPGCAAACRPPDGVCPAGRLEGVW
ncbi:NACHT domain-containing protein [Embleya sp. NPDC059259]